MVAKVTPLVVIIGETASGKTALAIELAQKFNGEIICADSRTVYRGMDIGTAKPTKEEQAMTPHHLLDIRDPDETYNVVEFQKDAKKQIREISKRGKLPIMVGGSGLYVDSVIYDYTFSPTAERDTSNPRHTATGQAPDDKQLRDNTLIIGLKLDKDNLEVRIQERMRSMLSSGLIDEVKSLISKYGYDNEVLRGSGYYAFADYINGTQSLDESSQKFMRTSTLLAKKQRTWFKRNKSIQWINNREDAVALTTTLMNKK
jgi:tRNA dimethylallyltransferase